MVQQRIVLQSLVNSFHYLYTDASQLQDLAAKASGFERTRYCRTALLLYIFSLEGLINRALDHFLPPKIRDYLLEREQRFSIEDKWVALPLLADPSNPIQIEKGAYPWSHFLELVQLRNDFVHPKHDRPAYYYISDNKTIELLDWKDLPTDLGVKEKDIVYRQTMIPKDPYAIMPEHLEKVRKVVDDTVAALDELLGGKLTASDWLHNDSMKVIHPPGATLKDVPKI